MIRYAAVFLLPLAGLLVLAGCAATPSSRDGQSAIPPEVRGELRLLAEPLSTLAPAEPIRGSTYVVRRNDTLYGIARRYGCDWRDIVRVNPGVDPMDMPVGLELKLPPRSARLTRAEVAPKPASPGSEVYTPVIVRPLPARSRAGFIWPLRGRIIRRFGDAVGGVRSHGIAIQVEEGAQVLAAKAGTAYRAADVPGFGKVMLIHHGDGTVTFYGHNSRLLTPHGATVAQGEVIALAGGTGRAAGSRLAFILCRDGAPVDPLRYLP